MPPVIRVFEPALCCNTGVCGPDVDAALVEFTADLRHLQDKGADIQRHNLANDPTAFATDATVRAFLQVAGSDGLPLTLVDGVTALTGRYPTRAQLLQFAGLHRDDAGTAEAAQSVAAQSVAAAVVPQGAVSLGVIQPAAAADGGACCGPEGCC